MSGGSHGYIYKADTADMFNDNQIENLNGIINTLTKLNYQDAAKEVIKLKEYIEQSLRDVETMQDKLRDLLHDVEWYDSSDIGIDKLNNTIERSLLMQHKKR